MKLPGKIRDWMRKQPDVIFLITGAILWMIYLQISSLMIGEYQRASGTLSWRVQGWCIIGLIFWFGWIIPLLLTLICWLVKFLNRKLAWGCLLGWWGWAMYTAIAGLNVDAQFKRYRVMDAELYGMVVIETFSMGDSFNDGRYGNGTFSGDGPRLKEYLEAHFNYKPPEWDKEEGWRTEWLTVLQESENCFSFKWREMSWEAHERRTREREKKRWNIGVK